MSGGSDKLFFSPLLPLFLPLSSSLHLSDPNPRLRPPANKSQTLTRATVQRASRTISRGEWSVCVCVYVPGMRSTLRRGPGQIPIWRHCSGTSEPDLPGRNGAGMSQGWKVFEAAGRVFKVV